MDTLALRRVLPLGGLRTARRARGTAVWLWLAAALWFAACSQAPSARAEGEGWTATLEWSPQRLRALQPARLVLRVTDRSGGPVRLQELHAQADMPEMSHEPEEIRFRQAGEGTYEAAHKFSMDGRWRVRVTGRWDRTPFQATFELAVGGP